MFIAAGVIVVIVVIILRFVVFKQVDGNWSEWQEDVPCSAECGGGMQVQKRECNNPKPEWGGKECDGEPTRQFECNTQECPIDGGWSDWKNEAAGCSKPCGGGKQDQFRTCDNPEPQFNGKICDGIKTRTIDCNTQPCPIDGKYSAWESQKICKKEWNGGKWTEIRKCNNPAPAHGGKDCEGPDNRLTEKVSDDCLNHQCHALPNASKVPESCIKLWYKQLGCDNEEWISKHAGGHFFQTTKKNDLFGNMSWRSKQTNPNSQVYKECKKIHGGWSGWSNVGNCSQSCGEHGMQKQIRTCTNPKPSGGGNNCKGPSEQDVPCNRKPCPINGGFSDFKDTHCESTWNDGKLTMTRTCDNPKPAYGGIDCVGSKSKIGDTITNDCLLKQCDALPNRSGMPVECIVAWYKKLGCDNEQWIRKAAPGHFFQNTSKGEIIGNMAWRASQKDPNSGAYRDCRKIDGGFSNWMNQGGCSKTCGTDGKQKQVRLCNNPAPSGGGKGCQGESTRYVSCNIKPCPIDGQYGAWKDAFCASSWTGGRRNMKRDCNNPAPLYGGKDCEGSKTKLADSVDAACLLKQCNALDGNRRYNPPECIQAWYKESGCTNDDWMKVHSKGHFFQSSSKNEVKGNIAWRASVKSPNSQTYKECHAL